MGGEPTANAAEGQPEGDPEYWKAVVTTGAGESLWIKSRPDWRKVNLSHYRKARGVSNLGSKNGRTNLAEADIPVIRRLYAEGKSYKQIGSQFNIHKDTIRNIVRRLTWAHVEDDAIINWRRKPRGVQKPAAKLDEAKVRAIRAMAREGKSAKKLAREFGISTTTAIKLIRGKAWAHVVEPDGFPVLTSPFRKLNEQQVREMRRRSQAGESTNALAKEFGISRSSAGDIVTRKTYADVE